VEHPPATVDESVEASADYWDSFWTSGAALDLDGSTDERAPELERRIVLSQFITATQAAGDFPSQETGLVMNSWAGKFHLEMHWLHAAHFAMWGRPELLERSFRWYLRVLPTAKEIAARQGYPGARWPKHVGPDGRESPNPIGPLLLWQQPHPIHLAELLRVTGDASRVVDTYAEVVDETAEFLVAFLRDGDDGLLHLGPPIMPAQERYDPRTTRDPSFELAYVAWAVGIAQEWRERTGAGRRKDWDGALERLAPLPTEGDIYRAVDGAPTNTTDHPSHLAALGLVPPTGRVDLRRMSATIDDVLRRWDWSSAWGWDFPVMAMAAARVGRADTAVDSLLLPLLKNTYLANGQNCQTPNVLPLYLPGNGGLLAAVALMAAGTFGTNEPIGFPLDTWRVRSEGFPPRP
jgi:hypothetical protein